MHKANPFNDFVATLGEGPIYDQRLKRLYFIDIIKKQLCYVQLPDKKVHVIDLPSMPGTVILSENPNIIYLLLEDGLNEYDLITEKRCLIGAPKEDMTGYRFNDGKCDPFGHIIVGAMHIDAPASHLGTLYRVDPYGHFKVIDHNYHIPNGLVWDLDQHHLYCIDSITMWVNRYDYDPATGALSNFTHWISFKEEAGVPDGMTRDTMGNLYIAHWGGNRISKWYPATKEKIDEFEVDAEKVTSCTFYGNAYDRLFITTASVDLPSESTHKHRGQLFDLQVTTTGYSPYYYTFKDKMDKPATD